MSNTLENDLEKAKRLWQSMNEASGEEKPFPADEMATALSYLADQMANEDPDELIVCSCHGDMLPAHMVDMWGRCPSERSQIAL